MMIQSLSSHVPSLVQTAVPLADKNWFQTGGLAHYFSEPTTVEQLQAVIQWAVHEHLPMVVLGKGANILISDEGFKGLVIQPCLQIITHQRLTPQTAQVTAGAGATINALIEYCLAHNLGGLEEFSGIPGTVGGAVYINLHYFEFLISQFLVRAIVMEKATGAMVEVDTAWFAFGYNESRLLTGEYVLVEATFAVRPLSSLETAYAQGRRAEIIRHRAKRYPQRGTCGSFFRNFYQEEVRLESEGKKVIWVAYYLDKVGVKGTLSIGDAQVSHQHANMIVNNGRATTADIVGVARRMQDLVYEAFGIIPQPECRFIGFDSYPLRKD
jgi:UDP-N-acetylmuramate dehydrogenase